MKKYSNQPRKPMYTGEELSRVNKILSSPLEKKQKSKILLEGTVYSPPIKDPDGPEPPKPKFGTSLNIPRKRNQKVSGKIYYKGKK